MVEVIGDVVAPVELILPKNESNKSGKEGMLFLSGQKLWFHNGTGQRVVTSG